MSPSSSRVTLEICTENPESIYNAHKGGADRLELCTALALGGLTPSAALIEMAVRYLPTHVLIRPRTGNFQYAFHEQNIITREIEGARKRRAAGVVVGMLNRKGMPDKYLLRPLVEANPGIEFTFNRAFDLCPEPFDALEMLIDFGFTRILTSGKAPTAPLGADLLRRLRERAAGRITIMPGSGITPENILQLQRETGCQEFHASAKRMAESPAGPSLPGLNNDMSYTDIQIVRNLKTALEYAT